MHLKIIELDTIFLQILLINLILFVIFRLSKKYYQLNSTLWFQKL